MERNNNTTWITTGMKKELSGSMHLPVFQRQVRSSAQGCGLYQPAMPSYHPS